MIGYQSLKALAGRMAYSVKDVIALVPGNDPFYLTPHRVRNAEWFANLWECYGFTRGAHIRRIHYVLVSQPEPVAKWNGEPYENTENDWAALAVASRDARYLRLIPADALIDRQAPEPRLFAPMPRVWGTPGVELENTYTSELFPDFPDLPGLDLLNFHRDHKYVVEVWIEKSTQNDWLVPLCESRGVNLVIGKGEISEVLCRQAVERAEIDQRPVRIFYISDFDPGGRSMPVAVARKIEFHLRDQGLDNLDLHLRPLFLNEEQIAEYNLPRTPIKDSERRKAKFERTFGAGATELDAMEALHPGHMAGEIDSEIDRYLDPTLSRRLLKARTRIEQQLREIEEKVTTPYEDVVDRLRLDFERIEEEHREWEEEADETWTRIAEELEPLIPEVSPDELPEAEPEGDPDEPPLYDSKRDYFTQIDHYHDWQRRFDGAGS